ncbi:cyclin-dependent kinase 2-associated protein 1 isoform X1 [Acanthopagrus latus]|uniref:cyclin-dependent kinase 2-associated protein 1 isoform X1 n=1 Tax=Acanthopagrus latus TaxID=8177 RepID=UPI00187BD6F5|nr:cyclin-dependent kinase 2-associated protein 1 isoform X1 [Acanthopagrus latus]
MYHLCLLEPALFRFLHDAPRSELLIDLPLSIFMTLRGHLASEVGNLQSPSAANLATLQQSYRPLLSDYGPPSLGFSQGSSGSQVPQNKYAELLAIIEELGKEIRPTYAGSKSAMERLKRGIIHARGLVRECLAETERNARS